MRVTTYVTELSDKRLPVLVKESAVNYSVANFNSPEPIVDMMRNVFKLDRQSEEQVYLLCFTHKMGLLGVFKIGIGGKEFCPVDIKSVFTKTLLCGAGDIVLVHNHPSGDASPSREDIALCKRLSKAAEIMDVHFTDFIIVGEDFVSFRQNMLMED